MEKQIRVSAEIHRRAKIHAAATGQTLADLTVRALTEFLDAEEAQSVALEVSRGTGDQR